jgi:hypothetical protein
VHRGDVTVSDPGAHVSGVRVDHVLIAVDDFEAAAARLADEHGLAAVVGGRHTGLGTANWIVPLGTSYLELAGIVEPDVAETNDFGRAVGRALAAGGGPFAWCVAPDDFDATVARLGLAVNDGSRERPDGTVLSWRAAGFDASLSDPSRPFFLQWLVPPSRHPGAEVVPHRTTPRGISWVEVSGDERSVREWLGDPAVPVRVIPGSSGVLGVGIATDAGEVVIRR